MKKPKNIEKPALKFPADMPSMKIIDALRNMDQIVKVKARMTLVAEANQPDNAYDLVVIQTEPIGQGDASRGISITQGTSDPNAPTKVPTTIVHDIERTKVTLGRHITFVKRDGGWYATGFGGAYGIIYRAMGDVSKYLKHRLYKDHIIPLIHITPVDLRIPDDRIKTGPRQQVIKVGSFGQTARIWQIRDWAADVDSGFELRIPSAAPVAREEICEVLHGLEGVGFGPTKHGSFTLMDVQP
jgi:hypothetical protein